MNAQRSKTILASAALVLLPLLVYLPLHSAGFIWDDDAYVTQNVQLRSMTGLVRIWLDPRSLPQYYPLVHTTFWTEFHLWGLEAAGFHATNVLLHATSALLLWRVLLRLGLPGAWLAAAVFAVHPVMTESVAWITERKNVLSLTFALGSLWSYLRFDPLDPGADAADGFPARRSWPDYGLALLLYVGALLSKTVVCSLPAVIALLRWWKLGRVRARDLVPLAPFLVLGIAAGLSTVWLEKHHVGAAGDEWSLTPLDRVLLAGRALWFYAGKLAWPHPLVFFYPRWRIDTAQPWQWLFPIAALAVLATLWGLRRRIGRGPLVAVLIFGGVLFPALGFFDVYPFRYSFVADHFQYHASPALIALAIAASVSGIHRLGAGAQRAAQIGAIALLAVLATLTFRQAGIYHDLETLYRHTIERNPDAWQAYINLANHLSGAGRNEDALPLAREAVRLAPRLADAHNTLGGVLFLSARDPGAPPSRLAEAIGEFSQVLALEPDHLEALYNVSVALSAAGREAEASRYYAHILELDPKAVDAMVGLGRSLLVQGRSEEAEQQLRAALRLAPARADAHLALGVALMRQARREEAIGSFEEAVRCAPDSAEARDALDRARSIAGAAP